MCETACLWTDEHFGGPLAIVPKANHDGKGLVVLAMAQDREFFVRIQRFADFCRIHASEKFVCVDVLAVYGELSTNSEATTAFWTLSGAGRLVDLRHLDRQLRFARGDRAFKLREWSQIRENNTADRGSAPASPRIVSVSGERDLRELQEMLRVFGVFQEAARGIAGEIGPLPSAPMEQISRSAEETEEIESTARDFLANWGAACDVQVSAAMRDGRSESTHDISHTRSAAEEVDLLGHQVEIWAALSLGLDRTPAFTVDAERLPELLLRAEEEYERACRILRQNHRTVECFEWNCDQIKRNPNGFPVVRRKRLTDWLVNASNGLCDALHEKADMPRDGQGKPTSNPEHWDCWAACEQSLWAWRRVFRMAEVGRIGLTGSTSRPRYETIPLLRSREPNLAAYRSLHIPVFRPQPGHHFLAGRISYLSFHCLASLSLQRDYVPEGHSRLRTFILREDDPHRYIAREMQAWHGSINSSKIHDDPGEWRRLTDALFNTLLFGLPDSLSTAVMRNEFGIADLTERDFANLKSVMAKSVVYELGAFLEDTTVDQVTSSLGLSANEGVRMFAQHVDMNVAGRTLRNNLRFPDRRAPINSLLRSADERNGEIINSTRVSLGDYRGLSLGGRVTHAGTAATVRRHEVRMGAEDVMLAIAHDLRAAGYSLLGIAHDEFVLEGLTVDNGQSWMESVAAIVEATSKRILRGMSPAFELNLVDVW